MCLNDLRRRIIPRNPASEALRGGVARYYPVMLATYVPDRITVYEPQPLAAALRAACCSLPEIGRDPGDAALTILMAQIALETGRGKFCHGWDFGNIKASPRYVGQYSCFKCNEVIGGKVKWFSPTTGGFSCPPGHPQTRFRAYADTDETRARAEPPALYRGTKEYVAFIGRPTSRYHSAWLRALAGDAAGYVHELKRHGYFTADEQRYKRGVVSLTRSYAGDVAASHAIKAIDTGPKHQVDDLTEHSPTSDADLDEILKNIPWAMDPDWDAMKAERDEALKGGI